MTLVIFLTFFTVVVWVDLRRVLQEKAKKKYLWFALFAYTAALVVNIMIDSGMDIPSFSGAAEQLLPKL
ncbi:MAG: hypothetical protein LKJ21_00485 [Oscillospiraceae bacterium]|jgi:uncharacterized membrane protein|nr:hypothetical protein [Oscillospiraceae bacterium]MCI1989833.1 hypothetical protein [Oscillospiraceae bacterium]MCI2035525.1 hypothetical protein [Oscillospiraceae bacterium]